MRLPFAHGMLAASEQPPKSMNTSTTSQAPATETPAAQQSAPQSARALLKQLQQDYLPFRDCLPLSIGIDKQIVAAIPDINRKLMRAALGIHTSSQRYLRAMEKATVRYNLDGSTGAEVTDTHRSHAKEVLQERFKKEADRRKAEREAAAAEEAAKRRQEKLEALTAKFSRK